MLASIALAFLLGLSAWFLINWRSTAAGRRTWNHRRLALTRAAAALLVLEVGARGGRASCERAVAARMLRGARVGQACASRWLQRLPRRRTRPFTLHAALASRICGLRRSWRPHSGWPRMHS